MSEMWDEIVARIFKEIELLKGSNGVVRAALVKVATKWATQDFKTKASSI